MYIIKMKSTKRTVTKKSGKKSPVKRSVTKKSPAKRSVTKKSPAKRSMIKKSGKMRARYGSQKAKGVKLLSGRRSLRVKQRAERMSRGCTKQSQSKYASRPSPPYPANNCVGRSLKGNDGRMYVSKLASNGIGRWVPIA